MPAARELQPALAPYAQWLLNLGRQYSGRLVFTSTKRSRADQARLYSRWRQGQSAIPAAPPGRSRHESGWAFDMARPGVDPFDDWLLAALGEVWVWLGGTYGGKSDPVHFQV